MEGYHACGRWQKRPAVGCKTILAPGFGMASCPVDNGRGPPAKKWTKFFKNVAARGDPPRAVFGRAVFWKFSKMLGIPSAVFKNPLKNWGGPRVGGIKVYHFLMKRNF